MRINLKESQAKHILINDIDTLTESQIILVALAKLNRNIPTKGETD